MNDPKAMGIWKDKKDKRPYHVHQIENEIITTPASGQELVSVHITSETGLWTPDAFHKRFSQ